MLYKKGKRLSTQAPFFCLVVGFAYTFKGETKVCMGCILYMCVIYLSTAFEGENNVGTLNNSCEIHSYPHLLAHIAAIIVWYH